jgi:hypothetical protein
MPETYSRPRDAAAVVEGAVDRLDDVDQAAVAGLIIITQRAHYAQDSIKDEKTSVPKTLEDQDLTVEQHQN